MLTLTRRCGERIAIGTSIEITVLDVSGGRVRLGISAPRETPVHRGEVVERIERENQRAVVRGQGAEASDSAICFPDGLYGMRDQQSFLLCNVAEGGSFRVLVSRQDPMMRLLVVDATEVWPGYPVDEARAAAGLTDEDVAVAAVVTAPADGSEATVNLMAPIVIGMKTRRGSQVILERGELGLRHAMQAR
ncbi:MAG: carbon storage regulator CsrA [Deltaproteobacteria bacterium]|nr:carbon storage regulator CsrA [Deltaproteobacteria bacterium]